MELVVREARPEDAGPIVAVLNPIITSGLYTVFDAPLAEETERQYITDFPARGIFHVAVLADDGIVVGFQSMEPFATYTHAFDHVGVLGSYVDLARRRQGIATRLFVATFEAARRKGYESILTYIREDNPAALTAYARQGFRAVGIAQRHAKIRGRYLDEVIVQKLL